ncbi:MAG: hypothetical protein MI807_00245, partial [Verrucomicrobiales bacterium]|nr:hypothetical protein [Verrucomicrobiales bacterium]
VYRSLEALRTYDIIHVLTGGGPGTSMFTASIYSNRLAFHSQKIGMASAHLVLLDVVFYFGVFFLFRSLASAQHSIRAGRR